MPISRPRHVPAKLDNRRPGFFSGFLDAVERQLGLIDVLNNASIVPVGRIVGEPDDARRILDINVCRVILGSSWRRSGWSRAGGDTLSMSLAYRKSTP